MLMSKYNNAPSNGICGTSQGFVELESKDLCYIDEETERTLELLQNNIDTSNRKHSLMGYLNSNTSTTSGARLLREGIMRPLCHLATIEHRLNCIEYLVGRLDTLSTISNSIKHYGQNIDLDNVVPVLVNLFKTQASTLHMAEKKLDAITTVESLVSQVNSLVVALSGADQPMLNIYKIALEDPAYAEIIDDIRGVIEPEAKKVRGKREKLFRVKLGVESLFDVARSTYTAAISDLEQYVKELHQEDGLPWKLSYGETRGYYLSLSTQSCPKTLHPRYIRVVRNRTLVTCITKEMMQSNVRANISYENSMKLLNEILSSLLSTIMNNISSIYKMVDIVGMLDLITSFAKLVVNSHGTLIRPRFTPSDTLIAKSRHPVLESIYNINGQSLVPNDIIFSAGSKNFMLVTGPNMGGKSVFLKQVAIIQIIAQLGCYVPAESAHLKLMNRIVARSGTSNDSQSNCSSFMWEMRGIASALKEDLNAPNQSVMYIIDEVGRGTSIDDGSGFSFAIAEELALRRNCFTVFATHFDQVLSLTCLYANVIAYHFKYDEESCEEGGYRSKINHRLIPGIGEKNHYGIRMAETCGIPHEIIEVARKGLDALQQ